MLAATASAVTSEAPADSPFNGIWIMDLSTATRDVPPEKYSVANGCFSRGAGETAITVKADGRFHRLSPGDYVDAVAVTVTNRSTAEQRDRWHGRMAYSVSYRTSRGGRVLTGRVVDYVKPDRRPVATVLRYARVGKVASGGSLVAGRWRLVDAANAHSAVAMPDPHTVEITTYLGMRAAMVMRMRIASDDRSISVVARRSDAAGS